MLPQILVSHSSAPCGEWDVKGELTYHASNFFSVVVEHKLALSVRSSVYEHSSFLENRVHSQRIGIHQ